MGDETGTVLLTARNEQGGPPPATRHAPRLAYGAVAVAAFLVLGRFVSWPGEGFTVHLSVIPYEERVPEERDALPMLDQLYGATAI